MLPSQRALFDMPREVCFLNAASWSPLPLAAQEAGRIGVARKGRPWLIDQSFAAAQHERARSAAARLINADAERRGADLVGLLWRRHGGQAADRAGGITRAGAARMTIPRRCWSG